MVTTMPRVLRPLVVAALALAAASAPAATGSGLHGRVLIDPATPVCRAGTDCTAPAKGVRLRFSRQGRLVATARTDSSGRYRVTLRPGTYAVAVARQAVGRGLEPRRVIVRAGRYRRVDFSLDIGIR
jgi:Carboxypeptidase regulatory-like domain